MIYTHPANSANDNNINNNTNTISINVDDAQTDQHFNGQPLRGIVDEFVYGFMHDKKDHDKE